MLPELQKMFAAHDRYLIMFSKIIIFVYSKQVLYMKWMVTQPYTHRSRRSISVSDTFLFIKTSASAPQLV